MQETLYGSLKEANQSILNSIDEDSPDRVALTNSLFNTKAFPLVHHEAQSFKELATTMVDQFEYLFQEGIIQRGIDSKAMPAPKALPPPKPKSILKRSQSP